MTDGTKQHQTINFIRNITITTFNFNGLHDDRKKNTKNLSNNTKQKKSYNLLKLIPSQNKLHNGKKNYRDHPTSTRVKYQNQQG